MNTPFEKLPKAAERIVYVRAINVADLPLELREQAEGLTQIYAVHRGNGERLALVANKSMAFALARDQNYAPVSVH